jgi:hypothetical protein
MARAEILRALHILEDKSSGFETQWLMRLRDPEILVGWMVSRE